MELHGQLLVLLFLLVAHTRLGLLLEVPLTQTAHLPVYQQVDQDGDNKQEGEDDGDVDEEFLLMPNTVIETTSFGLLILILLGSIEAAAEREAVSVGCTAGTKRARRHVFNILILRFSE